MAVVPAFNLDLARSLERLQAAQTKEVSKENKVTSQLAEKSAARNRWDLALAEVALRAAVPASESQ